MNSTIRSSGGPPSRTLSVGARRTEHVAKGIANVTPVVAARASGSIITDIDGRTYIDFSGGIGVQNIGHCHPAVVAAIQEQAAQLIHTCFHVAMYEPYINLAEQLNRLTPGDFAKKTILVNSGAEAVENAVKIARKATGRQAVVTLDYGFHGRTLLAMTMTDKTHPYKSGFGPFAPEVYKIPSPYAYRWPTGAGNCVTEALDMAKEALSVHIPGEQVAALVVEPVQGEGGFIPCPDEYLVGLRKLTDQYGILLVADEIQSGFARTGKFYACEHSGVVPDLTISAKSLAAGMPLAAVTGRAEVMDAVHVGGLGGTYAGNPVAVAAALAVIQVIEEEGLVARAARQGEWIRNRLEGLQERFDFIGDARGMGPMQAVEFVRDRSKKEPDERITARVHAEALDRGLILMKAGIWNNVIRFLAPLNTPDDLLEQGFDIFERALEAASGV